MRTSVKVGAGVAAALVIATPFVAGWEGLAQDPYYDIAGVYTVCYGETANVERRRHSVQECQAKLNRSIAKHAAAITPCLPPTLPVETYAAYVSFAYNVGPAAFCGSTAAKRVRAGDLKGSCAALAYWNKAKNPKTGRLEVSRGLQRRRDAERRLCEQGLA